MSGDSNVFDWDAIQEEEAAKQAAEEAARQERIRQTAEATRALAEESSRNIEQKWDRIEQIQAERQRAEEAERLRFNGTVDREFGPHDQHRFPPSMSSSSAARTLPPRNLFGADNSTAVVPRVSNHIQLESKPNDSDDEFAGMDNNEYYIAPNSRGRTAPNLQPSGLFNNVSIEDADDAEQDAPVSAPQPAAAAPEPTRNWGPHWDNQPQDIQTRMLVVALYFKYAQHAFPNAELPEITNSKLFGYLAADNRQTVAKVFRALWDTQWARLTPDEMLNEVTKPIENDSFVIAWLAKYVPAYNNGGNVDNNIAMYSALLDPNGDLQVFHTETFKQVAEPSFDSFVEVYESRGLQLSKSVRVRQQLYVRFVALVIQRLKFRPQGIIEENNQLVLYNAVVEARSLIATDLATLTAVSKPRFAEQKQEVDEGLDEMKEFIVPTSGVDNSMAVIPVGKKRRSRFDTDARGYNRPVDEEYKLPKAKMEEFLYTIRDQKEKLEKEIATKTNVLQMADALKKHLANVLHTSEEDKKKLTTQLVKLATYTDQQESDLTEMLEQRELQFKAAEAKLAAALADYQASQTRAELLQHQHDTLQTFVNSEAAALTQANQLLQAKDAHLEQLMTKVSETECQLVDKKRDIDDLQELIKLTSAVVEDNTSQWMIRTNALMLKIEAVDNEYELHVQQATQLKQEMTQLEEVIRREADEEQRERLIADYNHKHALLTEAERYKEAEKLYRDNLAGFSRRLDTLRSYRESRSELDLLVNAKKLHERLQNATPVDRAHIQQELDRLQYDINVLRQNGRSDVVKLVDELTSNSNGLQEEIKKREQEVAQLKQRIEGLNTTLCVSSNNVQAAYDAEVNRLKNVNAVIEQQLLAAQDQLKRLQLAHRRAHKVRLVALSKAEYQRQQKQQLEQTHAVNQVKTFKPKPRSKLWWYS